MSDPVKVISCEKDAQASTYIVGLSDGDVDISAYQREIGSEWVPDEVLETMQLVGDKLAAQTEPTKERTVEELIADNAMLQRALDEANETIARLNDQLASAGREMKAPASVTNVFTRNVADLVPLGALQPHPTMPEDAKLSQSDAQDVADHLERKRLAKQDPAPAVTSPAAEGAGS